MPVVSKRGMQTVRMRESLPLNPPPYSPRPPILRNNRYKTRQAERRAETMFLSKREKCFLMIFAILSCVSLLTSTASIIVDQKGIVGTDENPSFCMLSDTHNCITRYANSIAKYVVAVAVRVDIMLSCITFVCGVLLSAFKIFNCRILVGFFLFVTFKMILIANAILMIFTTNYYFDIIDDVFYGHCDTIICIDENVINITVSFLFLSITGFCTCLMMLTVFTLGNKIIRMLEDTHEEATWAKWDAMTADLVAY